VFSRNDAEPGWFDRARGSRQRRTRDRRNGATAEPIEVHLPDGGRVVLSFEISGSDCDQLEEAILAAVILAEGTELDLAEAIRENAISIGLRAVFSVDSQPTMVIVRR